MTINVADDKLGRFARQQHDWFERVRKGSLNPDEVMKAVQTLIDVERFPMWKTLYLGTGLKTADDFRNTLEYNGHHISDQENDMLNTPAFQQSLTDAVPNTRLDLCVATVKELTGKDRALYWEIITAVKQVGELLPDWAEPLFWLQHADQTKGELFFVVMKPVPESCGTLDAIGVEHDLQLGDHNCVTSCFWDGDDRLVFLHSKPVYPVGW